MVKKRCTFKNLEENLKNLEEILKTWKKFRKPGENFQKTFGHPVLSKNIVKTVKLFKINNAHPAIADVKYLVLLI